MGKKTSVRDIQDRIISEDTAHLTYHATELDDVIHPYSVPGYEYLSGGLVEFLERFRTIIPEKMPVVLEISGLQLNKEQQETVDGAIWMHYGLKLSETAAALKRMRKTMFIYIALMILSSSLLFLVSDIADEVITNYAYVLFWFFGYRILTYQILDYKPVKKDYQWYLKLSSLKLTCSSDENQSLDADAVSEESSQYAHKADVLTKKGRFVKKVLMEDSYVDLGCVIRDADSVVVPSGAGDMEIVSDEMADYLMSAIPFIKQKEVTKLTIEGKDFSEEEQERISSAIRNQLAFTLSEQEAESQSNKSISILFAIGLLISTVVLFVCGRNVDLAVHEFILVAFWFFADYLLEFAFLSRKENKENELILEKLANMEIVFNR